ncbi:MAG: hypothetical protein JSW61_13840 [Candidatus Thorarchaeota archaeon]|nr:MAG: hypothetical protein JSW61_13840 [Candidatus Thorarchaeota archaeon]
MQIPFDFFDFFSAFGILFMIVPLFMFVVIIIVFVRICKGANTPRRGFRLEMPSYLHPQRSGDTRTPHTPQSPDVRAVRLPNFCSSCGADISHESVEWTGPLEAKCGYCGGTVKAQFERI